MTKEIRSIRSSHLNISLLFGFGSFFKGVVHFNDVDLLAVASSDEQLLESYYALRAGLKPIERKHNVSFDLNFFTKDEFADDPLLDMWSLVEIW